MNHRRRASAVLVLLLGTGLLSVLPAGPAGAADGCLQDVSATLMDPGCDDTTPPDTATGTTVPRMTAAGWINKRALRVELLGTHPDADPDEISFECVLSQQPTAPADPDDAAWRSCSRDVPFTGLTDTASNPYVLFVRAVDASDDARAYLDLDLLNGFDDEPTGDYDATPARLEFRVDTVVPDSYLLDTPSDPITPQLPMVTDDDVTLRLAATEAAAFVCTLDATAVPCASGSTELRALKPGDHTFTVRTVDPAGNADPSPASTRFAVPTNLTAKKPAKKSPGRPAPWKKVRNSRYLGGDYLLATERGAKLKLPTTEYGEVRLLATTGPDAGVIEIKLGGSWRRVSLKRPRTTKRDQIQVLDELSPRRRGAIRIRVVSQGKPVQLDGLLAH